MSMMLTPNRNIVKNI